MSKARDSVEDLRTIDADLAGLQTNITAGDTAARAGRKNLIINGGMQVAQRGTSDTSFTAGYKTCDRWRIGNNQGYSNNSQPTVTQSTDAPAGFGHSMRLVIGTDAGAAGSTSAAEVSQFFEGQDLQHLEYGTATAKTLTASLWVKSSLTGIFSARIGLPDNSRSHANSFTINTANTWEKKTLTFAGDTTTAIANTNTSVMYFAIHHGYGSGYVTSNTTSWQSGTYMGPSGNTNLGDTAGASFQFTGVQLEVGSGTDFEHRSYGEELQLCKRYWRRDVYRTGILPWAGSAGGTSQVTWPLNPEMRGSPTISTNATPSYSNILGTAGPVGQTGTSTSDAVSRGATANGVYISNNASGSTLYAVTADLTADAEL